MKYIMINMYIDQSISCNQIIIIYEYGTTMDNGAQIYGLLIENMPRHGSIKLVS